MEHLSLALKHHYNNLHKPHESSVLTRTREMNHQRKMNRQDGLHKKRNIPDNLSPFITPEPKRRSKIPTKLLAIKDGKPANSRWEKLLKWKEEKQRQKEQEKNNKKPLFKVTHIPVKIGLPDLENVNKEVKGRRFDTFAPINHKFKPPANIKPININSITGGSANAPRINTKEAKKTDFKTQHSMITRSKRTGVSESTSNIKPILPPITQEAKTKASTKQKLPNKKNTTPKKVPKNAKVTKGGSNLKTSAKAKKTVPDSTISINDPVTVSSIVRNESTPHKTEPPTYISPFVTVSRGKCNARSEFEKRKLNQSFSDKVDEQASPKAGAAYFTWILNKEIKRLQNVCNVWTEYKKNENPSDDIISMIDVVLGQTNLLITKKFMQFRGLIDQCNTELDENPVTCEDLHGFWDMMHLQIDNVDKRFENLTRMRDNNWEEIQPVERKDVRGKKKMQAGKNAKASAGLKEAIQAARQKKVKQEKDVTEPLSSASRKYLKIDKKNQEKTPVMRRSLVKTDKRLSENSPGLMMMKVAQYAKSVEGLTKSILKRQGQGSSKSLSRSVLFKDEANEGENDLNKINVEKDERWECSKENVTGTTVRRSSRLSKTKLF